MVEKESHSRGLIPSGVLSEGHQLPNFAEFELMAFFLPKIPSQKPCQEKNDIILQKMLFAICAI